MKKRKIVFLLVVFCVIFLGFRMVGALENDSKLLKKRINGVYAVTKYDDMFHLFYLDMYTFNGEVSYCIELGVDVTTSVYNSTSDFSLSKLSLDKVDYVKSLIYFGYGYEEHTDYKYYMATQELIWEYLKGVEIEWTNELDFYGKRINIDKYKNDIMRLVDGLDLRGYIHDMDVNIGQLVDITDVSNNLQYYDVISGEHSKAKIDGNMLYINFDDNYVGEETIVLKRKRYYENDSKLFYKDDSKKFISRGDIDEKIELSFNVSGLGISFYVMDMLLVDKNNQYNYEGISFGLYNEDYELIDVLYCNSEKLFIDNMVYGKYYVKQISTNDAYIMNNKIYSFVFDENFNDAVKLEVIPLVKRLEVTNLFNDNGVMRKEEGSLFEVYNKDGSFYKSFVTDSEGIGFVDLPFGEYIIKQNSGKEGYYLVDDFHVSVNKTGGNVLKYTLINEMVGTKLVINSILDDDLLREENIYYKIFDVNNNRYLMYGDVDIFENRDGQVVVPVKIGYGEYVIEVINNSKKYDESEKNINIKIDGSSDLKVVDGEFFVGVDFYYEFSKGEVIVNSLSSDLDIIEGVLYEVYSDNSVIYRGISNDEGVVKINNLLYGEYCLRQKNISDEYYLNEEEVCFYLDESVLELEVVNKKRDTKYIEVPNTLSDRKSIKKILVLSILLMGGSLYKLKKVKSS